MASSICIEPGCSEPRFKTYNRCETHARELRQSKRQSKTVQPSPVIPVRDPEPMEAETADARKPNGKILHGPYPKREVLPPVTSLTGRHAPLLEPEPSEVQPEPVTSPPVAKTEQPAPVELSTGQIVEDCAGCVHADILNIVSVMYPEIADTVDILTRAKHIERDLKVRANGRNSE